MVGPSGWARGLHFLHVGFCLYAGDWDRDFSPDFMMKRCQFSICIRLDWPDSPLPFGFSLNDLFEGLALNHQSHGLGPHQFFAGDNHLKGLFYVPLHFLLFYPLPFPFCLCRDLLHFLSNLIWKFQGQPLDVAINLHYCLLLCSSLHVSCGLPFLPPCLFCTFAYNDPIMLLGC